MAKDDVLFGYRQQLFAEAARTNVCSQTGPTMVSLLAARRLIALAQPFRHSSSHTGQAQIPSVSTRETSRRCPSRLLTASLRLC